MKRLLIALLVLFPAVASAQYDATYMRRLKHSGKLGTVWCANTGACKVLDTVAADASASSRTFILKVGGFSKTTIQANLTRSAGTAVTMTCTGSLDNGTTYASIASTAIASGAGTVSPYVDTWTTSATGNIFFEYDTRALDFMSCVVAVTSGVTADKITIYAVSAVGN